MTSRKPEHEEWEIVYDRDSQTVCSHDVYRMKVPGGWLYRVVGSGNTDNVVFVQNPGEADGRNNDDDRL
jgi:hypothetical protein